MFHRLEFPELSAPRSSGSTNLLKPAMVECSVSLTPSAGSAGGHNNNQSAFSKCILNHMALI